MVGVKSSKGCATCLRRSIKCDEQRPTCSQCRRGGRRCPGYVQSMSFIDEGIKLRNRRQVTCHASSSSPVYTAPLRHNYKVKLEEYPPYSSNTRTQAKAKAGDKSPTPLHMVSPRAEQDQLFACFVHAMFPLGIQTLQISLFGTWLWHIPSRLGYNLALDYSAMAVALGYFGRATRNSTALKAADAAYMTSLKALAWMLGSKEKQFESEVLCATMLMGHYETFGGTAHWITHAGGAARLMRQRGARRSYESAFEYSMFLACRGTIISHALLAREPCFLAELEWKAVPDGLIEFPLLPKEAHLYHIIFGHYAAIPGLIQQIRSISPRCSQESVDAVLQKAALLLEDLDCWFDAYVSFDGGRRTPMLYTRKDTKEDEYPFDDAYTYLDTITSSNITAYYAYRILVQLELDVLVPGRYAAENTRLAEAICKSVPFLSTAGYCGAQVIRFTLLLAQKVLPSKCQPWIAMRLASLEKGLDKETLVPGIAPFEKQCESRV